MWSRIASITAAVALHALALPGTAQTVQGVVAERASMAPVEGSLVVLVDSAGSPVARALSDRAGRFVLRAAAPGRHRLRAERVGYESGHTPPFDLTSGQSVEREIVLSAVPMLIEGLTVEARRRCTVHPEVGRGTARLWEEVRKALEAASFTQTSGLYSFRVRRYERHLDVESLRVREESAQEGAIVSDRPFVSLPAERLLRDGFVEQVDGGFTYYAPDPDVLLSDAFLDEYCFRIVEAGPGGGAEVGLSFRPTSRRGPPAIRGTLWIDRTSLELRSLEYTYTRAPLFEEAAEGLGGRIEFEALPTGAWIVRRWWIRMPAQTARYVAWRGSAGRRQTSVSGIKEDGGEVVEVLGANGALVRAGGYAALAGAVYDSAAAAPLAGAAVSLVGTGYSATTDLQGRFRMDRLPEGSFSLTYSHPRLRVFGIEPAPRPVSVRRGEVTALELGVPSRARAEAVARRCPKEELPADPRDSGVLVGQVRRASTGAPLGGAELRVAWTRYAIDAGVWEDRTSVVVSTDENGAYLACGVPRTRSLLLRVVHGGRVVHESKAGEVGAVDFLERDLVVDLP